MNILIILFVILAIFVMVAIAITLIALCVLVTIYFCNEIKDLLGINSTTFKKIKIDLNKKHRKD